MPMVKKRQTRHTRPPLSADEAARYVGKQPLLEVRSKGRGNKPIWVRVQVFAARNSYGRVELEVMPVNGQGSQWVHASRLRFDQFSGGKPDDGDGAGGKPSKAG
jgi:hypothetical protein